MSDKRQKTGKQKQRKLHQQQLAFAMESRNETSDGHCEGPASPVADSCTQSPTGSDRLMESICDPATIDCALARVIGNDGAPGVDGMKVSQLEKYFERHLVRITEELLSGTYRPQPVKRVELRKLGVGKDLAAQSAGSRKGGWHLSRSPGLNFALTGKVLSDMGLPPLTQPETKV